MGPYPNYLDELKEQRRKRGKSFSYNPLEINWKKSLND